MAVLEVTLPLRFVQKAVGGTSADGKWFKVRLPSWLGP